MGCEVEDRVSGFHGTVIIKHEVLGGNVMWSVQPKAVPEPGKAITMPESISIDQHMLVRTGDGISESLPVVDADCTIKPGQKVKDKITGYEGTATEKVTFQNGCIYFSVEGPLTQKLPDGIPKSKLFIHSRLDKKADGVSKDTRLVPQETAAPKKPPGGPMVRNASQTYSQR